jgi:hypothetical protein
MKKRISALVILATIIVPGIVAKVLAQSGSNSVTITNVTPSPDQVGVTGTFTVASGYTFNNVTVYVRPPSGAVGEGGEGVSTGVGSFYTNISVPAGTYDVQAMLTVSDSNGNPYYYLSDTVTNVSVPS